MNKILYIYDDNKISEYKYDILEDTIIYHFSFNSSSKVLVNIMKENVSLYYYYNNINYDNNSFDIKINHNAFNTHSELFNHGVNVKDNKLNYSITSYVPNEYSKCICNQDNQIINLSDGKSTIKPNLLIDNFDVNSSHSAYIGTFKNEDMFYLMSRGISRSNCYKLLLKGFLINSRFIDVSKISDFMDKINNI